MNRKLLITVAILSMALTAGLALAQSSSDGKGRNTTRNNREWRGAKGQKGEFAGPHMRMLQRLDLTDRQKEQVKKIQENGKTEATELRKQLNRLQNQMHGEMLEDQPDRTRVLQIADDMDGVHAKMHRLHLEQWLDIRALLTAEQRDKLLSMPMGGPGGPGMHGRHGRGMGQGRGRGPGMGMGRGAGPGWSMMDPDQGEGSQDRSQ